LSSFFTPYAALCCSITSFDLQTMAKFHLHRRLHCCTYLLRCDPHHHCLITLPSLRRHLLVPNQHRKDPPHHRKSRHRPLVVNLLLLLPHHYQNNRCLYPHRFHLLHHYLLEAHAFYLQLLCQRMLQALDLVPPHLSRSLIVLQLFP